MYQSYVVALGSCSDALNTVRSKGNSKKQERIKAAEIRMSRVRSRSK